MEIGDIYMYGRHYCGAGLVVRNVGGVKSPLFLKYSNCW